MVLPTQLGAVILLAGMTLSTQNADLKYTVRYEILRTSGATQGELLPEGFIEEELPEGPADVVHIISRRGVRSEYRKAALGQPAGAVSLLTASGLFITMFPNERVYYSVRLVDLSSEPSGFEPKVSTRRTGEFSQVAGLRVERVSFEVLLQLPLSEEVRLEVPELAELAAPTIRGDSWIAAEKYRDYAALAARQLPPALDRAIGLSRATDGGIILRQVIRMNGYELLATVTQIGEVEPSDDLFRIPSGYREIPSPFKQ